MNPISHPILYSKDSKHKVRVWYMEQNGADYRTVAGLQNGNLVTSEWTTAKPKNVGRANATTGEEQALAEIQSKYLKQLKTGYHKDIGDIHTQKYIEPMLAQKYKDRLKDVDFESGLWGVQPKLNGCVSGDSLIITKSGPVTIKHLVDNLICCDVLSRSINGKLEFKPITNHFLNKDEDEKPEWYEIELESGEKINITSNHPVYLPELNCWREVKDLKINDVLLTSFD